MITLAEARQNIGNKVIYRDRAQVEEGVITEVNDRWVFVRYGADAGSKATSPLSLKLLAGGKAK